MRHIFTPLLFLIALSMGHSQTITGELRKWHSITIEFNDDGTYSETGTPNPFLDRRLNVTFTSPSNNTYVVPGYFAADGNAAESSANTGNKWHVKFSADEIGTWTYTASFREGSNVAVSYPASPADGSAGAINGQNGSFTIIATNKSGRDFRGTGRLQYNNERYLKFAETNDYFVKAGADSPETLLAFEDFDNTSTSGRPIKSWSPHVSDWNSGDITWQGNKGRGLIGALNYLSEKGMNAFSFLTMNVIGDGRNVWPWAATAHSSLDGSGEAENRRRYDVSKLAQWDLVFSHADKMGLFLHFKTQETENDQLLDGGNLGTSRKLYYRELIARFGHHLALNWNLGEENTQTTQQRLDMIDYFYNTDPYRHPIVIHNSVGTSAQNQLFTPLIGPSSELSGVSLQTQITNVHDQILGWVNDSEAAGKPWIVASDEQGSASVGVASDASYSGNKGSAADNRIAVRKDVLWGTLMAGGHGVEYYFGSNTGETDMVAEDFRSRDIKWDDARHALEFFNNYLPFWEMSSNDGLNSDPDNFCLAKVGEIYAVFVDVGSSSGTLDIGNTGDSYELKWFNPRNGGSLVNGSVTSVTSNGSPVALGSPPSETSQDWVALLQIVGTAQPTISIDDVGILEGADAVFTVTLNTSTPGGFTVDYDTQENTASEAEDFTQESNTINFVGNAGETQTITISTIDDSLIEGTEDFFVVLSNVVGATVDIQDGQGTATISDNDIANLTIDDVNVTEGGQAVFTVTLDNSMSGGFSVDFTTTENTALSDVDYQSTSGVLNFSGTANETQTISVNTLEDAILEPQEGFYIDLSNIQGAIVNIADSQGEVTIDDNDTASITINDISIEEGENAIFSISLDNEVSNGFSVNYATEDNTAEAGSDFDSAAGTLNFSGIAGEIETIIITTTDDSINENDEQFFLNLLEVFDGEVNIADAQGSATISDNDNSEECPADYNEVNGVVVIEAENLVLPAGWNAENTTTGFTGTGYINWTGGNFFNSPGNGTITSLIKINTPGTYLFEWRSKIGAGGSATDNNDSWLRFNDAAEFYGEQPNGSIVYPKGSGQTPLVNGSGSNNWFKIYTNGVNWSWQTKTNDSNSHQIFVRFDTPGVYTMEISGRSENHFIDRIVLSANGNQDLGLTETLCEGNQPNSASISIDDLTITEGTDAVFTVSLDNAVSGGFTVDFATANNSASAGEDYTANTGTLSFAGTAGETQTITIATTDDALVESNEDFFVNLTNATNGVTIADAQGIATITDNDIASNITIDDLTITEGTDAVFTVSLDNAVSGGFTVDFATANNSASAGEDYTANTGTLTFAGTAGETQTITIATTDDALVESNEDFFVNLTNATNGVTIADAQGIATILDNDAAASIFIDDVTITEGTDAFFTVSLNNAVTGGFTVDFATANNSATAGEDYTANTGTLTFAGTAGETQTISIATTDDALVESNEDFFVNLTNATNNVTIGDAQGIATITDNDIASNITIDDLTITEGTDAVFTVSLDNSVPGGFSVDFTSANNSATAGEDYTANMGTLTFAGIAGETQTISIATTDDALVESNEDFFVNLTNATNNVTIADSQGIATITDNDAAASISIDDLTITEGSDAVFTVSLDNSVSGGFSVDFATANNSATAGEDYTSNTDTLTFTGTAGETQTITIATADDALVESNEDFFVNLTNATNNVTIANAQGTATINDNDSENEVFPTIDILDAAAEEGNTISFPVTLSTAPSEEIELTIGFVNISTTDADYDSSPQTLVFQVGQTEQNISVALVSDQEEEEEESFQIIISEVIRGNIENPDETAIGNIFEVPQIIVFPVPFVNEDTDLNVSGLGEGTYGLSIFTLSGQTLASEIIEVSTSTLAIPVDDIISNGTYVLVLENAISGDKIIKRFIIQR